MDTTIRNGRRGSILAKPSPAHALKTVKKGNDGVGVDVGVDAGADPGLQ
jgi:hypothetical protein